MSYKLLVSWKHRAIFNSPKRTRAQHGEAQVLGRRLKDDTEITDPTWNMEKILPRSDSEKTRLDDWRRVTGALPVTSRAPHP